MRLTVGWPRWAAACRLTQTPAAAPLSALSQVLSPAHASFVYCLVALALLWWLAASRGSGRSLVRSWNALASWSRQLPSC